MKIIILLFVACLLVTGSFAQDGTLDATFNSGTGANGNVWTTNIQSDGKTLIGGNFTSYNGTSENYITRLNTNGTTDITFNSGTAANDEVNTITTQADGKILIGGKFTNYNGTNINRIARLNTDGTIDATFNPGTGANLTVWTIEVQPADGKIIIGGDFTSYNGMSRNRITRLNTDGSIDSTFNVGVGANNIVYKTSIQPDGKIIIGGDFTAYNGVNKNRITRLNTDGSIDPAFTGAGTNGYIWGINLQPDGKIIIGGDFTTYGATSRNRMARLNTNGSLDPTFNLGAGANLIIWTTSLQSDGKIIIGGNFTTYDSVARNRIARLNTDGSLDLTFDPGAGLNAIVYSTSIQSDGKIIVGGDFTTYNGNPQNHIVRVNSTSARVIGRVYNDFNQDCIQDLNETGLSNRILIINPGNIITTTNSIGHWAIDTLPAGNYTITADTSGNWLHTCPITQNFTVVHPDSFTTAPAFGFISTAPCSAPDITIHTPFLRPGFSNQLVYVQACNSNLGTSTLNGAYVIVELDPLLTVQSGSQAYTSLGNNQYQVNLGTLFPGYCVNFWLSCTLSTAAIEGQTLCMDAQLYPVDSCTFDTIPTPYPTPPSGSVTPCTLPWDRSSLQVEVSCVNDSVRFVIYNTGVLGNGDMDCFAPVRVYLDGIWILFDSIQLQGGDSIIYMFAGNGQTWRLEADQHPLHPGNSHPNATIENCGTGTWIPNLVNILPMNDADPMIDIYCGLVRASYDPNDKTGYPLGVGSNHDIEPNQDMEYVIRFQNTGTDTAFTVVIRDTLSMDYDVFSVLSGVSSHDYSFRMYGPRVLEWTFSNIMLPDSNVNQVGSNGFVTFKVKQKPNLPNGTVLENAASIYFDFNAPIFTNTSWHTVQTDFAFLNTDKQVVEEKFQIKIYPNPTTGILNIDQGNNQEINITVLDNLGRVVLQQQSNDMISSLNINHLSAGVYYIAINNGKELVTQKVIKQ